MFIGRYLSESCFSHVQLLMTLGTVACQAPLSMWFSRQEYWSGLSCSSPGDLPHHLCKSLWTPRKLYIFHLLQTQDIKKPELKTTKQLSWLIFFSTKKKKKIASKLSELGERYGRAPPQTSGGRDPAGTLIWGFWPPELLVACCYCNRTFLPLKKEKLRLLSPPSKKI